MPWRTKMEALIEILNEWRHVWLVVVFVAAYAALVWLVADLVFDEVREFRRQWK